MSSPSGLVLLARSGRLARLQRLQVPRAGLVNNQGAARLSNTKHANCNTLRTFTTRTPLCTSAHITQTARKPFGDDVSNESIFAPLDTFTRRHVGVDEGQIQVMLEKLNYPSLDDFVDDVVPENIRIDKAAISNEAGMKPMSETEMLMRATELSEDNEVFRNFIGMGYHNAVVPPVILRNVLENPAWYTQYTPYQPEISQGRLESLLNFQTMCTSLTGLDISNASLLDEATAAAEAMIMAYNNAKGKKSTYLVDRGVLPQTMAVLRARGEPFGIKIEVAPARRTLGLREGFEGNDEIQNDLFGAMVQYPNTRGEIIDWSGVAEKVHKLGGLLTVGTDLLALTMLKPPGEFGADIAVGNSARFGVPLGSGGPHAAFFSCTDTLKRKLPGRLVGVSKDAQGNVAYRLALQTREQHIRRDKATSNICTAQALLANMAAMYAIYHGPDGLREIAHKVHAMTAVVAAALERQGHEIVNKDFFDTLTVGLDGAAGEVLHQEAVRQRINLRRIYGDYVGITFDESTTFEDVVDLLNIFLAVGKQGSTRKVGRGRRGPYTHESVMALAKELGYDAKVLGEEKLPSKAIPERMRRTSPFLTQSVFNTHKSETDMLRYINYLQSKDLSLVHAIIPLGSCTMKLNSTTSMMPLSLPGFSNIHPFAPRAQVSGYSTIIKELSADLCRVTGFPAISLQPNSGAQGEYAGLSVIQAYHRSRGQGHRNICLIPNSAHGTNPASAIMAGMKVVAIKNKADGTLDIEDLREKAVKHKDNLGALMITYPSTYGVFEEGIQEACQIIHDNGGQVYLDGANMNAMIGLTSPAKCGADVCHMNLHKTFSIPHGGGGPGVGPIGVAAHLKPFLPGHPIVKTGGDQAIKPVTAAPFGSASILTISWAYIKMLGGDGLSHVSKIALLNANYMAERLKDHYRLRYKNDKGRCAHEFLIDLAEYEQTAGLKVADFAKRLQDFGIHPPTCSWPISTAMLIEPTESEGLAEIDRFCDAMITIKQEADDIVSGKQPRENNIFKNAPHPVSVLAMDEWDRPYTRQQAVYPDKRLRRNKFWPASGRVDEVYGERNLVCECGSVDEYTDL